MINLTRFSGQRFALNPDLIERVESTPDTVITLVDGSRQVVNETLDEVVTRVQHCRASIIAMSHRIQVPQAVTGTAGDEDTPPALRLISKNGGES